VFRKASAKRGRRRFFLQIPEGIGSKIDKEGKTQASSKEKKMEASSIINI